VFTYGIYLISDYYFIVSIIIIIFIVIGRLQRSWRRRQHDVLHKTITDDRLSQSFGFRRWPLSFPDRNCRKYGPEPAAWSLVRVRSLWTYRRADQTHRSKRGLLIIKNSLIIVYYGIFVLITIIYTYEIFNVWFLSLLYFVSNYFISQK